MVDAEDLTVAINARVVKVLNNLTSAITRSSDSNVYKLLYGILDECETFNQQIETLKSRLDIPSRVQDEPNDIDYYIDLFESHLLTPRSLTSDGEEVQNNIRYWTRLVAERHSRLSDGSYGDIANYVHALSGLGNPFVGAVPIRDENNAIVSIHQPYNSEEFTIHELWEDPFPADYISDALGITDRSSLPQSLKASFEADKYTGHYPLTVQFTNTSSGFRNEQVWMFGDGSQNTMEENPIHTFSSPGEFCVSLSVISDSESDTIIMGERNDFLPIHVSPITPYHAYMQKNLMHSKVGEELEVTAFSKAMSDRDGMGYWMIDFGDRSSPVNFEKKPFPYASSKYAAVSTTHTYSKAGTYEITLTVANNLESDPQKVEVVISHVVS